jgi:glycosyltransferase 2 family protein
MLIGLIVFALYLYFFVGFTELSYVLENLNPVDYAVFYSLAIAGTLLSVLFIAAAWQSLLGALSIKAKLKSLFLYTWAGTFVDLVVPCQAVCGEVTRIYLVRKDNRENYGAIAASSITNRIISYVISSIGLLTGIVLLLSRAAASPFLLDLLIVALMGTVIYLVVLFYLAFDEKAPKNLATVVFKLLKSLKMKRFPPEELSRKAEDALTVFHQGFETFRKNPKHIVKPMVYQLIALILNIAVYMLVFYSIGFKTMYIDFFIIAYFIVGTVQIAAAVFSVGTLEIILTNLFVLYGVPLGLSGLAATLLRLLTFWLPILVGYVTVQVIGARSLLNPKAREGLAAQQSIEEKSAEQQKKQPEAGS